MKGVALAFPLLICAAFFFGLPRAQAEEDVSSTLSAPPLAFSVTPGTGGGPWKMRIENTGEVPIRIAADPRLLVLEVTAPVGTELPRGDGAANKRAKPGEPVMVRCVLPDDARPATDEGRDLVIPSRRAWSTTIDPLLYCFGARERASLVASATVKAHFGWSAAPAKTPAPATKRTARLSHPGPPFVAAPVGAAVGKVAPAKELEAAAFTLGEGVPGATRTATPAAAESNIPGRPTLSVSMPDTMDVARGFEVGATVTVANDGDKAATLLFRPETVRFAVSGPQGSVACGSPRYIDSPIRELYSTIAPRARASLTVLLTSRCPVDTFDEPGIYRVTAILDTSGASARSIGLKTWDGEATARAPLLLRVRTPRRPSPTTRPVLD